MKAKTDSGPTEPNAEKPDYIANLFTLMQMVSEPETAASFEEAFNTCNIRYGDMKKQLAEDMIRFLTPVRERAKAIQNDKEYLSKIIRLGKEKAHESAAKTLAEVRSAVGVRYL